MDYVLVISPDGTVIGLWSDEIPWQEIGRVASAPRISSVEFDPETQHWVARDVRTGQEIARGSSRTEVLAEEHRHYSALLESGQFQQEASR